MSSTVTPITATTISDVRTIAVDVTDHDAALDFYVGTLGFQIRLDVQPTPTMRWVEIAAPDASVSIALTLGDRDRAVTDTGIRFAVPDAEQEHAEMHRKGVAVGDILRWEGVPTMFTFEDPDGNRFFVVEVGG
ncbi:MAG: VOC family protein [Dermatophilaceae bacterium]